ncbi:MAG: type II toxin-antitoxin system Phd/YefM family antitoxin [Dethiobacter sp.]|jgi:prevent-host-death family protein|nr:type II toxin-antitoxin system Phd/YefM family antitoxin [Dethiobacter sp.]
MTIKVNVHDAKTNLSKLLMMVKDGQEVIIAKSGKPVARLVPYAKQEIKRLPGSAKGLVSLADDFDAPLPEDVLESFEE